MGTRHRPKPSPAQLTGITPVVHDFVRSVASMDLRGKNARQELLALVARAQTILGTGADSRPGVESMKCRNCKAIIKQDPSGTWIDSTGGDGCIDPGTGQLVHQPVDPTPYIVITGNPVDGFVHHGPFDDVADAVEWATDELSGVGWYTAPLASPTETKPREEACREFQPDVDSRVCYVCALPQHRHVRQTDPGDPGGVV